MPHISHEEHDHFLWLQQAESYMLVNEAGEVVYTFMAVAPPPVWAAVWTDGIRCVKLDVGLRLDLSSLPS